jgi:hypothetical protein
VINTQDKYEALTVVKLIFFWVVTPCLVGRHISEKNTVSNFRAEDGGITNETKIMGNCSAQFHVITVSQQ